MKLTQKQTLYAVYALSFLVFAYFFYCRCTSNKKETNSKKRVRFVENFEPGTKSPVTQRPMTNSPMTNSPMTQSPINTTLALNQAKNNEFGYNLGTPMMNETSFQFTTDGKENTPTMGKSPLGVNYESVKNPGFSKQLLERANAFDSKPFVTNFEFNVNQELLQSDNLQVNPLQVSGVLPQHNIPCK
jgi:hypothetical protein